jgi:hypothetical protein
MIELSRSSVPSSKLATSDRGARPEWGRAPDQPTRYAHAAWYQGRPRRRWPIKETLGGTDPFCSPLGGPDGPPAHEGLCAQPRPPSSLVPAVRHAAEAAPIDWADSETAGGSPPGGPSTQLTLVPPLRYLVYAGRRPPWALKASTIHACCLFWKGDKVIESAWLAPARRSARV